MFSCNNNNYMNSRNNNSCNNNSNNNGCNDCPDVFNIMQVVKQNTDFRRILNTSDNMQVTAMCISPNDCIGLENHANTDQFICIVCGCCKLMSGNHRDCLTCQEILKEGCCCIIPANTWHNVVNIGSCPLKLFSIYAPPENHNSCGCMDMGMDMCMPNMYTKNNDNGCGCK